MPGNDGGAPGCVSLWHRERARVCWSDVPPGKGNGGGKALWPGWLCGSKGLAWAWPSAA